MMEPCWEIQKKVPPSKTPNDRWHAAAVVVAADACNATYNTGFVKHDFGRGLELELAKASARGSREAGTFRTFHPGAKGVAINLDAATTTTTFVTNTCAAANSWADDVAATTTANPNPTATARGTTVFEDDQPACSVDGCTGKNHPGYKVEGLMEAPKSPPPSSCCDNSVTTTSATFTTSATPHTFAAPPPHLPPNQERGTEIKQGQECNPTHPHHQTGDFTVETTSHTEAY